MKEASLLSKVSKFLSNFTQVLSVVIPMLVLGAALNGLMSVLINNLPYWLAIILIPLSITAIMTFMFTLFIEILRRK
jgi:cell shape-determining protein MreD